MPTIPRGFLELLRREWRAQPDDTVGGWCVTLGEDPRSPGAGALPIAMFLTREVAEHIASVHNASLGPDPDAEPEADPLDRGAATLPAQSAPASRSAAPTAPPSDP